MYFLYTWKFTPYQYTNTKEFSCIANTVDEARIKGFEFLEEMNNTQHKIDQIWRQLRENLTRVHLSEYHIPDNTQELVRQKEKLIRDLPAMIEIGNLPDLSSFTKSNLATMILTSPCVKPFYPISLSNCG